MKSKAGLLSAALFCLCAAQVRAEDWPLGFPSAAPPSANAVPLETLRKYALKDAKNTWGEVMPGPEIPCRDSKGALVTYMFVFRLGASPFKAYGEIQNNVRSGRKMYEEGAKEMRRLLPPALAPAVMSVGIDAAARSPMAPPALQQPSPELLQAQEKFQSGRRMRSGAGEYGTVVMSARNDLVPLPQRIHGLPDFYNKLDLLQDKARETLGGEPKLTGIYYMNPAEQWYEFSSGGRSVLLDSRSMKIISLQKHLMKKAAKQKRTPAQEAEFSAMKQKIQEEWQGIENGK